MWGVLPTAWGGSGVCPLLRDALRTQHILRWMQRGLWWTRGGGGHRRPLNHPLVGGHPQSDVLYRSTNARTPASPTPCIPPRYYPALKALGGQLPHRLASALLPGPAAPPSGAAAPGPPEHHKLGVMAVLLTSVPFGLAALASLALAHHSDHSRERVLHLALPFLVTGVVLAAFPAMVRHRQTPSCAALCCCCCCVHVGVLKGLLSVLWGQCSAVQFGASASATLRASPK